MANTCIGKLWATVLDPAVKDVNCDNTACGGYVRYIFMEGSRALFCTEDSEILSFLWMSALFDINLIVLQTSLADSDSDVIEFEA